MTPTPLPPGRELDELVCRAIFGQEPCDGWVRANMGSAGGPVYMKGNMNCKHAKGKCYPREPMKTVNGVVGGPPRYSQDIAAAWEVVVEMGKRGKPMGVYQRGKKWRAHCPVASNTWFDADTAPHAISLAALEAEGHEVPE